MSHIRDKPDPSGDYLIWRQLMTEAGKRKLPVVFITDDRKEDWYRREHGLTLGARYELREEMLTEAGVPFLIMTTSSFLIHAGQYLHVPVSPETVSQAKELPDAVTDDRTTALEAEYQARLDSLRRLRREIDYQIKSASDDVYRISDELDQISAKARDEQWSDEEFMLRMRGLRTRLSDSKEIVRRQMERKEEVDGMLASAERGLGFARLGELRLG